jgi:hypothetical protein
MRQFALSLAALAVLALPVRAAPPDVPATLKTEPGQMVRLVVKGEKVGTLKNFSDSDAFFDELTPRDGERRFVFQATKPGVYVVGFWTAGESEGVACTITVGPSVPPPPPPPPPIPDPLRQSVRDALAVDKAKPDDVLLLAALYREAAKLSVSAEVPSSRELLRRVREAGASLLPDVLVSVRRVVASELANALGKSNDEPLTEAERKRSAELFAKLAGILEELAK